MFLYCSQCKKSIEGVVNRVIFWNEKGTVDPDYIKLTSEDATSQSNYDVISSYIADSKITTAPAASLLSASRVYDVVDRNSANAIMMNILPVIISPVPVEDLRSYQGADEYLACAGKVRCVDYDYSSVFELIAGGVHDALLVCIESVGLGLVFPVVVQLPLP